MRILMREVIYLEDELLTILEVSKVLKVNVAFVHKLRKAGLLKCLYCGSYKVRKATLLKFMADYDGKDLRDLNNIKDLEEETPQEKVG